MTSGCVFFFYPFLSDNIQILVSNTNFSFREEEMMSHFVNKAVSPLWASQTIVNIYKPCWEQYMKDPGSLCHIQH